MIINEFHVSCKVLVTDKLQILHDSYLRYI